MLEALLSSSAEMKRKRFSYLFIVLVILAVGWLKLAPLMLTALFSYLALQQLHFFKQRGKWLAVLIFLVLLSAIGYAFIHFIEVAVRALPEIANKAIPSMIAVAKRYEIELPFTDYDSLRESALEFVTGQAANLGNFARYARGASTQILFVIAGCVVSISIFLTPRFTLDPPNAAKEGDLYTEWCQELGRRFKAFFQSFATVIGAQILISALNTVFTAVFVIATHLPYAPLVLAATFLCGLLPVVGNLISNTIIVGIGFTISPQMALTSLIYLVMIHKLEYFLNSRIIGHRIRNPLWLTLLGLIIGERLMGVPGIVLAPVFLNYIRLEASQIPGSGRNATEKETPPKA